MAQRKRNQPRSSKTGKFIKGRWAQKSQASGGGWVRRRRKQKHKCVNVRGYRRTAPGRGAKCNHPSHRRR